MEQMRFTKMQGLGNDYVYVNCFKEKIDNPPELARRMASLQATGISGSVQTV